MIRQIIIDASTFNADFDATIDNVPTTFNGVLITGEAAVTIGRDNIIDMKIGNAQYNYLVLVSEGKYVSMIPKSDPIL